MKRDMDLIRKLLIFFSDKETPAMVEDVGVEGYTDIEVGYNLILLYDAGMLIAEPEQTKTGRTVLVHPFDLTWDGHELLDKIRNETIWDEIKSGYREKGLKSVSIDILKTMSDFYIRKKLGLCFEASGLRSRAGAV